MSKDNFIKYAKYYDLFYADKDYAQECKLLDKFFRKNVKTILDLGCGTGSHDLILANSNYKILGIDKSASMLKIARIKIKNRNVNFKLADMRKFYLRQKVDATIAMFNTVGYLQTIVDFQSMLRCVRSHLNQNGFFIFDLWQKSAVLSDRPKQKIKIIKSGDTKIFRIADSRLDLKRDLISIDYYIFRLGAKKITEYIFENHIQRFHDTKILKKLLEQNHFEAIKIFPFGKPLKKLKKEDWHIQIVARAT